MRLMGKQLLMLVGDGVDRLELEKIKMGFEEEDAAVLVTSPLQYLTVETAENGRRGEDLPLDIPFDALEGLEFDGLIIPDGILSTEMLRRELRVIDLISRFHEQGKPIFASGNAVQLLYDSRVLSHHVVVREGTPLSDFLDQAVSVLLDAPAKYRIYRPSI